MAGGADQITLQINRYAEMAGAIVLTPAMTAQLRELLETTTKEAPRRQPRPNTAGCSGLLVSASKAGKSFAHTLTVGPNTAPSGKSVVFDKDAKAAKEPGEVTGDVELVKVKIRYDDERLTDAARFPVLIKCGDPKRPKPIVPVDKEVFDVVIGPKYSTSFLNMNTPPLPFSIVALHDMALAAGPPTKDGKVVPAPTVPLTGPDGTTVAHPLYQPFFGVVDMRVICGPPSAQTMIEWLDSAGWWAPSGPLAAPNLTPGYTDRTVRDVLYFSNHQDGCTTLYRPGMGGGQGNEEKTMIGQLNEERPGMYTFLLRVPTAAAARIYEANEKNTAPDLADVMARQSLNLRGFFEALAGPYGFPEVSSAALGEVMFAFRRLVMVHIPWVAACVAMDTSVATEDDYANGTVGQTRLQILAELVDLEGAARDMGVPIRPWHLARCCTPNTEWAKDIKINIQARRAYVAVVPSTATSVHFSATPAWTAYAMLPYMRNVDQTKQIAAAVRAYDAQLDVLCKAHPDSPNTMAIEHAMTSGTEPRLKPIDEVGTFALAHPLPDIIQRVCGNLRVAASTVAGKIMAEAGVAEIPESTKTEIAVVVMCPPPQDPATVAAQRETYLGEMARLFGKPGKPDGKPDQTPDGHPS